MNLAWGEALAYFISRGWTVPQAAGIVANLVAESKLSPSAVGDGGLAYGIAQWHPDRQAGFEKLFGRPIRGSSVEDQLAWVDAELRTTERAAGDSLRECASAYQAGACVSEKYERPADRAGEAARRGLLAESLARDHAPSETQPAAPIIEDRSTELPPEGKLMDPVSLLSFLGPMVAKLLPVVGGFLKSDKAKANIGMVSTIFDTITNATGAPNLQAAVEKMQDPVNGKAMVDAAHKAIITDPVLTQFLEVGGGVAAARDADIKVQQLAQAEDAKPFYKTSAVFWISAMLLPLIYWYVGSSVMGGIDIPKEWPWYAQLPLKVFGIAWDAGARVGLANLVVGLVLGGICGVYYGISVTQAKQQQQQADQAAK